jgi:hypothetical protein
MLKQNYFYKSIFAAQGNLYRIYVPHVRNFSISQTTFTPHDPFPATDVAPFEGLTDEIRSFLAEMLVRDILAIEQLDHTIQDNNDNIRDFYSGNLIVNNDAQIALLNDLIEQDINVRRDYRESTHLLTSLYEGEDPPIHNMSAWLDLKNDLDNNQDVALQSLREYVQQVIDTHIRDQFVESTMDVIREGRENLSETASRDNSQYSDELDQSDSGSSYDSSVYHSANTHQDESSSSDSDSNDNAPIVHNSLNSDNNLSDTNIDPHSSPESNDDNMSDTNINQSSSPESNDDNMSDTNINQSSSSESNNDNMSDTNINQSSDQNKSNSDEKLLTDDALDVSDTLHMFYDESSVKKSTIDFVLEKQQEEMPDIMDSDGGE